jgi:hypothetical protein
MAAKETQNFVREWSVPTTDKRFPAQAFGVVVDLSAALQAGVPITTLAAAAPELVPLSKMAATRTGLFLAEVAALARAHCGMVVVLTRLPTNARLHPVACARALRVAVTNVVRGPGLWLWPAPPCRSPRLDGERARLCALVGLQRWADDLWIAAL